MTVRNWNLCIGSWPKWFELTSLNEKTLRMKVRFFIHGKFFVIVFSGGFHLIRIIYKFQMLESIGFFCTNLFWLMLLNSLIYG